MSTLKDRVLATVRLAPGLTDREVADQILGRGSPQQGVNQVARKLAAAGTIVRRRRQDGLIANCMGLAPDVPLRLPSTSTPSVEGMGEEVCKEAVAGWLKNQGWDVAVAWGKERGVDIRATMGSQTWLIEVKGCGSRSAMRVNYFLGMLGETLQRMDDANAEYSIALPDLPQFRGLWNRLPRLAKERTTITALFVTDDMQVIEA